MIFLGYLLCALYVCVLGVIAKLAFLKTGRTEFSRKFLHAATFGVLFIAKAFFNHFYHFAILCGVAAILVFLAHKFNLIKSIERTNRTAGEVYYCISLFVCSLFLCFFDDLYPCLVAAFAALALGDGSASVFGKLVKTFKIRFEKTLGGTIACCLFTFLALLILSLTKVVDLPVLTVVLLALSAGLLELVGKGLDNFTVPLGTFLLCFLCTFLGETFTIAALIGVGVFFVAFLSKFISYFGAIFAGLIGGAFFYFGGIFCFLYLLSCYAVMLITHLIRKKLKADLSGIVEKTKSKDFLEIFVNGFFALVALVLMAFTKNTRFLYIALLSVSGSFVDSLSSDIGTLSKTVPKDILTGKTVEKGISGGVSWLGTLVSLFGAGVFAIAIYFLSPVYLSAWAILLFVGVLFFATVIDSVLGSLIQAKYRCGVCGKQTEKKVCCDAKTAFEKGWKFMNNDAVNFVSAMFTFALAFLVFIL